MERLMFEVDSRAGSDVVLLPEYPGELRGRVPRHFEPLFVKVSFGTFQHWKYSSDQFEIWFSRYHSKADGNVRAGGDVSAIEFHCALDNVLVSEWERGAHTFLMRRHQIELTYLPFVNNLVSFRKDAHLQTLDIHYRPEYLVAFLQQYPELNDFLNEIHRSNRIVSLFGEPQFLSATMLRILRQLTDPTLHGWFDKDYFDGLVRLLTTLLLERLQHVRSSSRYKSLAHHLNFGLQAQTYILDHPGDRLSIEQLSRKLGVNKSTLQQYFADHFGDSIAEYRRKYHMMLAAEWLLRDPKEKISLIGFQLGYPEPANFCRVFKSVVGITPEEYRQRGLFDFSS